MFQEVNAVSDHCLSTLVKSNVDVENRDLKYVAQMKQHTVFL